MIGTVEEVTKTKSGKALRVKLAGTWYGGFLDSGLDKAVGKTIEAQITPDKGWGLGIGQWSYSQAPAQPSPANTAVKPSNGDRWWLPFVSNQVAHAIQAGRIQTPADMNAWAKAAKECVLATDIL